MDKFYEIEKTRKYINTLSNDEKENLFAKLNIQMGLPQRSLAEVKEIIAKTGVYNVTNKIRNINPHG
jgi:hypothetical protein